MSRNHRQFNAFIEADALLLESYRVTEALPFAERFGMQSQIRRAAVSAPSNIVEGSTRSGVADYCRFLEIARGSSGECGYLFDACGRLRLLTVSAIAPLVKRYDRLSGMLYKAERQLRDRLR